MLDNKAKTVKELADSFNSPATMLAPMIGSKGYSLPDIQNAEWTNLADIKSAGHVNVRVPQNGNNWLVAPSGFKWSEWCHIVVHENHHDNIIVIGHGSKLRGEFQFFSSGNLVIIGEDVWQPSQFSVYCWSNNCLFFWGRGSTSNAVTINIQAEGGRIVVGEDCMFAKDITVRDSDMHAVIDLVDEQWLNKSGDVLIEPHVWVAEEALILRDSLVGAGSIIGTKSVVRGSIPRLCTAAGAPAKVVRENVSWNREMKPNPKSIDQVRDLLRTLPPYGRHNLRHE